MEDAKTFGLRLSELRLWRGLTLRAASGLAGLSFSFWGQVERGEKVVNSRKTLEAMADALQVHPNELTEHPWAPRDEAGTAANDGLKVIASALDDCEFGADPGGPVRPWPQIAEDLRRLRPMRWAGDYAGQSELAPVLLRELHGAYLRLPGQRPEVLAGLMTTYESVMWTTVRLGALGMPILAARAVQQCAETLDDPVWLGYAAWFHGQATGELNRGAHYRRSVAAAERLTSRLNDDVALQACGRLHLSAAEAAAALAEPGTAATHLAEASALAARIGTEAGTWADLSFGPTLVAFFKTGIAMELGEPGQALEAAKAAHPEVVRYTAHQAWFWAGLGRAFAAEKKTREKAVRVLVHAERMAPQKIHRNLLVREVVSGLLRRALSEVGRQELHALAWRMGLTSPGRARVK